MFNDTEALKRRLKRENIAGYNCSYVAVNQSAGI